MTAAEIAADEAAHREQLAAVSDRSRRRPLADDALNPKPLPKNVGLGRAPAPFTSREEECLEMTASRRIERACPERKAWLRRRNTDEQIRHSADR